MPVQGDSDYVPRSVSATQTASTSTMQLRSRAQTAPESSTASETPAYGPSISQEEADNGVDQKQEAQEDIAEEVSVVMPGDDSMALTTSSECRN